jgi:hypothetical protein
VVEQFLQRFEPKVKNCVMAQINAHIGPHGIFPEPQIRLDTYRNFLWTNYSVGVRLNPLFSRLLSESAFFLTKPSGDSSRSFAQSSARSPCGAILTSFGSNWPRTVTKSLWAAMTSRMFL